MPSPKRRFLSSSEPTPPSTPVENPFRKVIAAAGVLLVLVMSVPMFADAVYGQSVPQNSAVDQTSNLISALTALSTQIGLLKGDITSLRAQMATGTGAPGVAPVVDASMADCLQSCRTKLSACLAKQPISTLANAPLDACRSSANNCMNACHPRTDTAVGCEDRCAVALGACVIQAGSDGTKLADCRTQNRKCVIAACRPGADKAAPSRVPADVCKDQCGRDLAICNKAAAFDREELAACAAVSAKCLRDVCTGYEVPSTSPFLSTLPPAAINIISGSVTASPAPSVTPTQTATAECENSCTAKYRSCSDEAGSNANVQVACNASYGQCREECRAAVGAGSQRTAQ
jgi:hypothetical protein